MVSIKEIKRWTSPRGKEGWVCLCPGCRTEFTRVGDMPSPRHKGAYVCRHCGRRIVVVE